VRSLIVHKSAVRIGVLALIGLGLACASAADKKRAALYNNGLETMRGRPQADVTKLVCDDWKFEVLQNFETGDPKPGLLRGRTSKQIDFTDQEMANVFASPGRYRVLILIKNIDSSSPTLGEINDMGMTIRKDAMIVVKRFAVLRLVLRDGLLVHSRIWPNMDSSRISSGTSFKRY